MLTCLANVSYYVLGSRAEHYNSPYCLYGAHIQRITRSTENPDPRSARFCCTAERCGKELNLTERQNLAESNRELEEAGEFGAFS